MFPTRALCGKELLNHKAHQNLLGQFVLRTKQGDKKETKERPLEPVAVSFPYVSLCKASRHSKHFGAAPSGYLT